MQERAKAVRDVMQTEVRTLRRNDKLSVADPLMKQARIRRLPVLDEDGELTGIVSQRDLLRGALPRTLGVCALFHRGRSFPLEKGCPANAGRGGISPLSRPSARNRRAAA